ncbi:hypothetical protein [Thermococcus sp.]|uniref:hypothetical protein n=1 Tax=Thermococcus sp. TaxID=35749 RepID=UPI0026152DCF|nr:hypothetical protein [Thermococcus sp.]
MRCTSEGLDKSLFDNRVAAIIISGDRIIGLNNVPGVAIEGEEIENGVKADVRIADGVELPFPITSAQATSRVRATRGLSST